MNSTANVPNMVKGQTLIANTPQADRVKTFTRLCVVTLISLYILIIIGAGVRASGAGMGCPDWPTCFGKLIPPTSVEQLPVNYQQIYADRGYAETEFNARKTWTEFGNRMASVVVGIFMLFSFFYGLFFLRSNKKVTALLFAMLLITAFQAWLGSVVVSSNLHPYIISTHIILALVIIAIVHTMICLVRPPPPIKPKPINKILLITCTFILLLQIGLGIQVREEIDAIQLSTTTPRMLWIQQLGEVFTAHMIVSLIVLNLFAFTLFRLWRKKNTRSHLRVYLFFWAIALLGSFLIGVSMYQFNIPAIFQPLHLLFATIQFGMLWHILLQVLRSREAIQVQSANYEPSAGPANS